MPSPTFTELFGDHRDHDEEQYGGGAPREGDFDPVIEAVEDEISMAKYIADTDSDEIEWPDVGHDSSRTETCGVCGEMFTQWYEEEDCPDCEEDLG